MRKAIKKSASKIKSRVKAKGTQLMSAARKRLQMEVGALKDAGILSQSDAKKLLNEFMKELNTEKDRFLSFAKKELTSSASRVKRKAAPVARRAIANYRKARMKKTAPRRRKR